MKKWHLMENDRFIGYAPNRAKARAWATYYGLARPQEIVLDERSQIAILLPHVRRTALYKQITN